MRSRHFLLRLAFIREVYRENLLSIPYINATEENAAAMMTKIHGRRKLNLNRHRIGGNVS